VGFSVPKCPGIDSDDSSLTPRLSSTQPAVSQGCIGRHCGPSIAAKTARVQTGPSPPARAVSFAATRVGARNVPPTVIHDRRRFYRLRMGPPWPCGYSFLGFLPPGLVAFELNCCGGPC